MIVISLQSGSNGNAIYVEAGGQRLLFDAGISGKQAELRLAQFDRDIRQVDALVISHDHADHTRAMGIYQRKFGLPIYVTKPTLAAANRYQKLGRIDHPHHFQAGDVLQFGPITIETIPTPHDGADGVAFVVDDGRRRLGILTDLGHAFDELGDVLASLDGALLESNYDDEMLAYGPYPRHLKTRIAGPRGHLSNAESADLVRRHCNGRLKWLCLGHLSGENNSPEIAMDTHRVIVGKGLRLHMASRHEAVGPLKL